MLLPIICVYCAVCWLGVYYFKPDTAAKKAGKHMLSTCLGRSLAVLSAPIALPYAAFLRARFTLGQSRREPLRRDLPTHNSYEFARMTPDLVVEPISGHFEKFTPSLLLLGYVHVGDFRMQPEPSAIHDRFLLSRDTETLADICSMQNLASAQLISVLSDGTCMHTCSTDKNQPARTVQHTNHLWISYLPEASIKELHRHHLEALREACARNGTRALRLRRDKLREVIDYDHRVFSSWQYAHGNLDVEPPIPDFSKLVMAHAEHVDERRSVAGERGA
jgi:hypothetical protein